MQKALAIESYVAPTLQIGGVSGISHDTDTSLHSIIPFFKIIIGVTVSGSCQVSMLHRSRILTNKYQFFQQYIQVKVIRNGQMDQTNTNGKREYLSCLRLKPFPV